MLCKTTMKACVWFQGHASSSAHQASGTAYNVGFCCAHIQTHGDTMAANIKQGRITGTLRSVSNRRGKTCSGCIRQYYAVTLWTGCAEAKAEFTVLIKSWTAHLGEMCKMNDVTCEVEIMIGEKKVTELSERDVCIDCDHLQCLSLKLKWQHPATGHQWVN